MTVIQRKWEFMTLYSDMSVYKMRELLRITLVCLCAVLLVRDGTCQDVETGLGDVQEEVRGEEAERKDGKSFLPGTLRKSCTLGLQLHVNGLVLLWHCLL